jgi:hypothetical protein
LRVSAIGLPCAVDPCGLHRFWVFGKRVHADRGKGCNMSYLGWLCMGWSYVRTGVASSLEVVG